MVPIRSVIAGGVLAVGVLGVAASGRPIAASSFARHQQEAPAVKEIAVTAKKYEYVPNKIDVPVGTTLRLSVTAEDATHGFEIEGVKDSCVEIKKGETKVITYTAAKAGTFAFKCCHFCGLGHRRMKGSITVR